MFRVRTLCSERGESGLDSFDMQSITRGDDDTNPTHSTASVPDSTGSFCRQNRFDRADFLTPHTQTGAMHSSAI